MLFVRVQSVSMWQHHLIIVIHCTQWLLCLRHDSIKSLEDLVVDESLVNASLRRPPIAHMPRIFTISRCLHGLCRPILNMGIFIIVIYNQVSGRHWCLLVLHELVCSRLIDVMRKFARHKSLL